MALRDIILNETKQWVKKGIITGEQQKQITSLYTGPATPEKQRSPIHISHIMIGLAAIIFTIGVMLFYAANWKGMPPAVKLVHVFLLIIAAYGAAFYLLALKKDYIVIGRVLLVTGMVSYGVGIMLVAQIFHISAHPTNGLLAWAVGVLAMAAVTREPFGYYLALLLFFIWNTWEFTVYNNPNYIFVLIIIIISTMLYKEKERAALLFSLFLLFFWFYQVNGHLIGELDYKYRDAAVLVFVMSHTPLGALLIALSSYIDKKRTLHFIKPVIHIIGWLFIFVPLFALSWPFETDRVYVSFQSFTLVQTISYCSYVAVTGLILTFLFKKGHNVLLTAGITAYSIIMLVLPLGNVSTRMVSTHLGIVLLAGFLTYHSYTVLKKNIIKKVMAFLFYITIIIIKFFGLVIFGLLNEKFRVAYFLGFVLFLTVLFLINQVIHHFTKEKSIAYPSAAINILSALFGYFIIYALSFKTGQQQSLFNTETVVIIMAFLFIAIAIGLYAWLWKISKQKIILLLSAITFGISTLVLLISGPAVSWICYSLIFNSLLLIMLATFIYYSTVIHSKVLLNLSIAGLILLLLTRYFDLFWDMLSGSLLFICTGIVVFIGGWLLERNRRRLSRLIDKTGK